MSTQVARLWLHDDSEEDLVGADWHQEAIRTTVYSLIDEAEETDLPWHVGDQLTLVAWQPNGDPWRPSPDVMVHPHLGPFRLREIDARTQGLPALVIEVLSKSTAAYDMDSEQGKAAGYRALGIEEIVLFDPLGEFMTEQFRGWLRVGGAYQAWQPDAQGRFWSHALGVGFAAEHALPRVYNREGRLVPLHGERRHMLTEERRLRAEQQEHITRLQAELARLRGERKSP
ncbi:MAG TPA: Uma2 family endonuclease [Chloroflexota bacterium]